MKKINQQHLQEDIRSVLNLYSNGRSNEALEKLETLKNEYPNEPLIFNISGVYFKAIGQFDNAVKNFNIALDLKPDFIEVNYNLGLTYHQLGNTSAALENYKKVVRSKPDFAEVHANLGNIFQVLNQKENAISSYQKAVELNPKLAEAHNNLGNIFRDFGELNEAVKCYEKAIKSNPDLAESHNNLGVIDIENGLYNKAIESYKTALSIKYDFPEAHANLGKALKRLGKDDEAVKSYKNALEINPVMDYILGDLLNSQMNICDWNEFNKLIKKIEKKIVKNKKVLKPFPSLALINDSKIQKIVAKTYTDERYPTNNTVTSIAKSPRSNKIKIGYFSPDFRNHAVASLISELFETHDRKKFEIHAFYFGPDTQDKMNLRIRNGVDFYHDISSISHKDVANLSRTLTIDIGVDLCGYTRRCRPQIFAERSAPIQINYLGYPGTMGANFIDYIIADRIIIPEDSQKDYCEKIIYMPNCYQVNNSNRAITKSSLSRHDLGLPESAFVFCCFHNSYKITPSIFKSWMRILLEVDDSVLWLFDAKKIISNNLKLEAKKLGVDTDRLVFASYKPGIVNFSNRVIHADLFLDAMPYNAHTMASDTLRLGIPVLTCMGVSFASRVCASLLDSLKIPELITTNIDEYESEAIELATNPKKLFNLKKKLEINIPITTLYNIQLFTNNLEDAYLQIYKKYQNESELDHIYL